MPSALETTLTRAWQGRGPLACALWPVSLLFRGLSGVRKALYAAGISQSERLPVPVVVVGNIFIGGTGKTPLTIWLVQALRDAGFTPGVVSRGFGGAGSADGAPREVTPSATPAEVGDEPVLIAARTACPVFVARKRAEAGRALLAAYPAVDVIVTDDGLQHYALQRDVEIVLFDGRGPGNGWTLPAGPLREPPGRQRDFTVVNTPELGPALAAAVAPPGSARSGSAAPFRMTLAGGFAERLVDRAERVPLAELAARGGKVLAAAGIGNPARFFGMLRGFGFQAEEMPLPDHHDFKDRPFAATGADIILVTEKDAVKCGQIEELRDDPRLWIVPVSAQIDGALADQIVEKIRGRTPA